MGGADCSSDEDRFSGMCDRNGCNIQPHMLGTHDFFGPGSDFQIDSTKPVTVTTQFITNDGTDHGKLTEVRQFYQQDGKIIEHPSYTVNGKQHNTITDDFCADWVAVTQDGTNFLEKGGLDAVEKAIDAGKPEDVEKDQADATVKFSDIKFGPIGSTTKSSVLVRTLSVFQQLSAPSW